MAYSMETREQFFAEDWPAIKHELHCMRRMINLGMDLSITEAKLYQIVNKFEDIIDDDQRVIADLNKQFELSQPCYRTTN